MKERIDYYNNHGSALAQSRAKAKRSGIGLVHVVCRKLWSYSLSIIALWIPVSNFRVFLHRLRGVTIGQHVFIGSHVLLDNVYPEYVILEDDCILSGSNIILTHSMPRMHFKNVFEAFAATVTIKKGAWLSAGVIVLPGVTVGEYSVVTAGSVVTSDVPPYSVVRGNPAEVISRFNKKWIIPV